MLAVALIVAGIPAFVIARCWAARSSTACGAPPRAKPRTKTRRRRIRSKTGTPTMGGLLFGIAPLVALLLGAVAHDARARGARVRVHGDRRVRRRREDPQRKNGGLRARTKFVLTAVAAVAFLFVAGAHAPVLLGIGAVPPWLWYGLSICVVLATTHAVNLTDGLDGLAGGTVLPPLLVFTCAAQFAGAPLGVAFFAAATPERSSASCSTTAIRRACSWATRARSRWAPRSPASRS